MANPTNDAVLEELEATKKLLILTLYASGIPSQEIDKAVKMGAANIRAMFSKKRSRISVRISKQQD
jgi:hypothetical protein